MNRRGFTLLEVLVSVALLSLVLVLLYRGFSAVTTTVELGRRASATRKNLEAARRILEEDLASIVLHPRWALRASSGGDPSAGPDLAFLRHRPGAGATTDTEWVQYWREPHPHTDRLWRWVRYAGPADNRHQNLPQDWWNAITRDTLVPEIVLDSLVRADIRIRLDSGEVWGTGWTDDWPGVIDIRLSAASEPILPNLRPSGSFLTRINQEDGDWVDIRVRPLTGAGPLPEAVP